MESPRKLFPRIPYSRQRARVAPAAAEARTPPFTKAELAAAHRGLSAGGSGAVCPRCKTAFASVRKGVMGKAGREVWVALCGRCRRSVSVPVRQDSAPPPIALDTLVSSRPPNRSPWGAARRASLAVAVHGAVIFAAVLATAQSPDAGGEVLRDTMFLVLPGPAAEKPPAPAPPPAIAGPPPVPKGFQTLVAPTELAVELPAIDLGTRFDPRDYSGEGVEGGVFGGMVAEGPAGASGAQPLEVDQLDEPPELLECGPPRYPRIMRAAGIEGSVTANFVIDSSGLVTPGSITVVRSTDAAFEGPAKEQIASCRYLAGRVAGRAVPVYVTLSVDFTLEGRRGA